MPRGAGLGGGAAVPRLEAPPRGGGVVVAVALGAGVHKFLLATFAVELHNFFGWAARRPNLSAPHFIFLRLCHDAIYTAAQSYIHRLQTMSISQPLVYHGRF